MEKMLSMDNTFTFDRILDKLAGNQDRHKISDELEARPDQITHFRVIYYRVQKKQHI